MVKGIYARFVERAINLLKLNLLAFRII